MKYDSLQATYEFKPVSLQRAYEFKPVPENFPVHLVPQILGASCQMWGEWIPTVESMNYHIYPRIGAYAEVFWTLPIQKDYVRFRKSLEYFLTRWKKQGIIYGPTRNNQILPHNRPTSNLESLMNIMIPTDISPELQTKLCLLEINATYRHRIELNQLNNQASVSFFLISERKVVRNTI